MNDVVEEMDVLYKAQFVETNGGELEPIWQVYTPEGCALVIRQRLREAGLLITAEQQAVIDAAMKVPTAEQDLAAAVKDWNGLVSHKANERAVARQRLADVRLALRAAIDAVLVSRTETA